jgi:hypothetical protein
MTFSKSGVSMSVGAGGARLTAGPRGTRVSFSKGGFYYRTRLDTPQRGNARSQTAPAPPEIIETPYRVVAPAAEPTPEPVPTEIFGDTTPDAVVEAMNRRIRRRNFAVPVVIVASAALFAVSMPWPIVAGIAVLSTVLATLLHRRAKCSALVYGDEEETTSRLEILHKAVAALRSADFVWSVREASAQNGLVARPPTLSRTKIGGDAPPLPRYLRTNITPAALHLSDGTLYFFPDRLFVWHSGRFSAVDYQALQVQFRRATFLEREKQPPDSTVESQMRRKYSDDSTIPVLFYGLVEIDASPALQVKLMTSRAESAQEFVTQMRAVTGTAELTITDGMKEPLYTHFDAARVPLFYNLTEDDFRQFQAIRKAFAIIAQCDCVWRYEGQERTDDWKRNAGAGTLVTRSRVSPTVVDSAMGFDSNVAIGFCAGNSTLFMFPDGCVAQAGSQFQRLGKCLNVNASMTSFREEEATPRDGEVVGKTWRYVNKSGGPDRRFNDNRQIPIYRYGLLEVSCGSWRIHLCLSRAKAAAEFATALSTALNSQQRDAQQGQSDAPPPRAATESDLSAAFAALGLQPGAFFDDVTAAYRKLAAQNHPDKVAHMAPEFRELAERKMRELNAAYDQIRAAYHQR